MWDAGGSLTTEVWDGSDYLAEYAAGAQNALYTTVDGEVLAELRAGTRRLYIPDPLGSTLALVSEIPAEGRETRRRARATPGSTGPTARCG